MPADSQQAGSRNSPGREGDLYPIDRRLPPHKYLLPASRLQQVRILQNVSIEQRIAILRSIITPFWEDDQRNRAAFCPQVFSLCNKAVDVLTPQHVWKVNKHCTSASLRKINPSCPLWCTREHHQTHWVWGKHYAVTGFIVSWAKTISNLFTQSCVGLKQAYSWCIKDAAQQECLDKRVSSDLQACAVVHFTALQETCSAWNRTGPHASCV